MPVGTTYWDRDGMHGRKRDELNEMIHLGARHMALRDGLWLQPEPLLHLGLHVDGLAEPVGLSGLYAAGDTNRLTDPAGMSPLMLAQIINAMSTDDAKYGPNPTSNPSYAVDVGKTYAGLGIATASLLVPGPEDVLVAGVATSRIGVAIGRATAVVGEAFSKAMSRVLRRACFVAGVSIVTVDAARRIESIQEGDRVVAAASTDDGKEPWVEVEDAPVEERGAGPALG